MGIFFGPCAGAPVSAHLREVREEGPIAVLTAAEMQAFERRAFDAGVDQRVVLESAGRAVATAAAEMGDGGLVAAVVGGGNNGADAIVALRTLRAWGWEVAALPAGERSIDADLLHGWEIPCLDSGGDLARAAIVIDGVMGTGTSGAPRPDAAAAIEAINRSGRPVLAVDGPSGVDLNTGEAADAAVTAAVTVTFGAIKLGLLLYPGRERAGTIRVAEIGLPPIRDPRAWIITDRWARDRLPVIPPDAYKGSVGLVAVVAGRRGVGGAAIMAAMGALRAGSGGVRIVSAEANRAAIHAAVPEAVFVDREDDDRDEAIDATRALLVGPGIGLDPDSVTLLEDLLAGFEGPMLLDADALTLIARNPELYPDAVRGRCVMTPHPGELARLLGRSTAEVVADRLAAAREAADRYGCVVLAKGAPSVVASPDGVLRITTSGTSGVATGGMGDTLGGIVAAFLAAGAGPDDAAALGIHFSGRAAERASLGRGLLPRDVAEQLARVLSDPHPPDRSRPPFLIDLPAPR